MLLRVPLLLVPLTLAVGAVACHLGESADVSLDSGSDAAGDEGEHFEDGEVDVDVDLLDGETTAEAGPMILVVETLEVIADDRLCDLDGDGEEDNAVADLGSPGAALVATVLNAMIAGRDDHIAFHFPWVRDLDSPEEPEPRLFLYRTVDTDVSDDFSGEDAFYANGADLDGCGEPLHELAAASLVAGELSLDGGRFPLGRRGDSLLLEGFSGRGSVAPHGASFAMTACGYWAVRTLAEDPGLDRGGAELSLFEELLAGGDMVGLPSVSGISPDVDVDGDGYERFEQDELGRVVRCVDGDGSVIEGRDCWQDPKIADGFALNIRLSGVSARFAGPEPGWEWRTSRACDGVPPEESAFGDFPSGASCAGLDDPCDPFAVQPCCDPENVCSGISVARYLCMERCTPVNACGFDDTLGYCSGAGACLPIVAPNPATDCAIGEAGCTTSYGVDVGTLCHEFIGASICFETCEPQPNPCPGDYALCYPRYPRDMASTEGLCADLRGPEA